MDFADLDLGGWGGEGNVGLICEIFGLNIMFTFLVPGNQNEGIFWEGIQEFSQHEVFDYSVPCL